MAHKLYHLWAINYNEGGSSIKTIPGSRFREKIRVCENDQLLATGE